MRKIIGGEIKPLYIYIFILVLTLVGSGFFVFCSLEQIRTSSWEQKVKLYLDIKGYDTSGFPMIEEPDIESVIYEIHEAIPYYTAKEVWPLTYFWERWMKLSVRILAGIVGLYLVKDFLTKKARE